MMERIISILLVFLLISCQEEKITPAHDLRGAAEQQTQKTLNSESNEDQSQENSNPKENIYRIRGTYHVDTYDVSKPVDSSLNIIEIFGNSLLDLIVRIGGSYDVDFDPFPIDLSSMDLSLLREAFIKQIRVTVVSDKDKAKLDFIKELKIDLVRPGNRDTAEKINLISTKYQKGIKCGKKCFTINPKNVNLIDFIGDTKEIIIVPELKIRKTPKTNFQVKIEIDFSVGVILPI